MSQTDRQTEFNGQTRVSLKIQGGAKRGARHTSARISLYINHIYVSVIIKRPYVCDVQTITSRKYCIALV